MTTNPFATELAKEHRRALLQKGDDYRLARVARKTRRTPRASWMTLRIRPIEAQDTSLLADVFARLSAESRLARFLYLKTALTDTELRYLTDVDHRHHEALVAITRLRREPVGVARFIRNPDDPATAEIAVAVVDAWQNRGVGSLLVTRLSARALTESISHFTALMSAGNLRARHLLGKLGDVTVIGRDGPTISYRVALSGPAPVPYRPRRRDLAPVGST